MFKTKLVRTLYSSILVLITFVGLFIISVSSGGIWNGNIESCVAILLAYLLLYIFLKRYDDSIDKIFKSAVALSKGDYSSKTGINSNDEMSELSVALNKIADKNSKKVGNLATDQNKLIAILSGMVEGVIAIDAEEKIIHMNESAGRILGVSHYLSTGKPVWEVIRVSEVSDTLASTVRDGKEMKWEYRLPEMNIDRIIELNSFPIRDVDAEVVGAVLVLHDVSELKKLETIRRDFVANVSHELKTPITAIKGLIEILIDDKELPQDKHDRFLQKIHSQSARLQLLVSDLLTLSKVETKDPKREVDTFDIRELVKQALDYSIHVAEKKSVSISLELNDSPIRVVGDREAIFEIATNLLENAIMYSFENGEVILRVKHENEWAVIEVEDAGIGIEPKDQKRIFERFYRVDKARSKALGGTGLGLSIVKHIALSHGGDVTVSSIFGKGSTFRVTLLLAES